MESETYEQRHRDDLTDETRDEIVREVKDVVREAQAKIGEILKANDAIYSSESNYAMQEIPFNSTIAMSLSGHPDSPYKNKEIPDYSDILLSNACSHEIIKCKLHSRTYVRMVVEEAISVQNEKHSPKARIRKLLSEMEYLKGVYGITDEDLYEES